ncbi:MAG: hypothetical protein CO002_02055 [Candidatus Portnoybacteria bacterium CG_4_8_14_3_um_filter_44_10]|uniref:DUF4145 domain-containing protein n=5 Tax=Candidatus Portnoyibacteriota TaxID=1817913 RepID=A0A2H0KPI8_9BACT|nr:MAG: hypothetical protein COV85_04090 [Candidatus Portnoybacteria bacterium CG11_big_fil_rev_8_21_14_0_20_44_10]PIS16964.1 MAG: hypothetical protein COT61_01140 [Candidatus Portnoybacteria bacterium CG09_land_8_20_14_0_10_44_13]PIW75433.1 MAG: hypothetical protein CO002_02055 [Candidatus Portnoybacteria bacterium CG_4_8_14_3_um_filter_44_10]PIZ71519.1 MAG: hypothetical protein COY11_01265 [Candidatus Portnoybacteria bacterium CG_4_10_14_0_2_um_filter_44_20]PJA63833.1 MAG: hypothetical protei
MPFQELVQSFLPVFESLRQNFKPPLYVEIISALLSIFFIFLIINLTIRSNRFWRINLAGESVGAVSFPKLFDKKWQAILKRIKKGDDANLKLAVIEADNLFDSLLQQMSFEGKDMGGRLEKLNNAQLSCLEEVWLAHKVRNKIVHEPGYHLGHSEAETAVESFEKAFKEFGVL